MPWVGRSHLNDRYAVAHNLDLLAGPDPVDDSGKFPGHLGRTQTRHGSTLSDKSDRVLGSGDPNAPANTPGLRHLAFLVDDIHAVVAGLRARGTELVGELAEKIG